MNTSRTLRTLSEEEAIELLPEVSAVGVDEKMIFVSDDLPVDFYEKEIEAGWFKSTVITSKGIPVYRVIWQLTAAKKFLSILAAIEIPDGGVDANLLGAGIEKIARNNNCVKIIFKTSRHGLVEKAKAWGATVTGVFMEKKIE